MTCCSVSQSVDPELGQAPTSQARPRDRPPTIRPSNLAARTVSLVEYTLSMICRDAWPVKARTRGSGEVLCACAKTHFFV